jgi:hypothetical protein
MGQVGAADEDHADSENDQDPTQLSVPFTSAATTTLLADGLNVFECGVLLRKFVVFAASPAKTEFCH